MNWKQFKNWLDKNIVETDELLVKIRDDKHDEYSNLSTKTLTDFCDSLEAALDNNSSYHLFPNFNSSKEFRELFDYQDCYFGKKTNQERMNMNDYKLLEKMFKKWKTTQNTTNINIMNTRNILLIGRTGSGKSTLANVLMGENKFTESAKGISATKHVEERIFEVDLDKEGNEKIRYRVIDTIGIGDTKMKPQGVLMRLAEMADWVKQEGLNQIFFVNKGRFTKEEIEAYDLLREIIFDSDVIKYTTIVRVGFPEFEDQEACDDDRYSLRTENADLAHILVSNGKPAVNIIYVDNPPLKGRSAEINEETREESRKRLLTYLGKCTKTYRPSNIDTLEERVQDYKTHEEKLKEKMKELERVRKQQEEEFRQKLTDLKEEQTQELRKNRMQFEEQLHKTKVESEEKLRTTVNELEDKQKKKLDEAEQKNKEQLKQNEERHNQDIKEMKDSQEQQKRDFQDQIKQNREESDRLRRELSEQNDNSELIAMLEKVRIDERERQDKMEEQRREFEWKRLEMEESRRKEEAEREERRMKEEKASRERMEQLERKKAAWAEWDVKNRQYLQRQEAKMPWNRDENWRDGLPKPSSNLDDYRI
ncbi:MAG: hypothetical protein MRERC_4c013 [Mycoplasmataceae bacterium RC_NB112A]|nr:MAG: hypothetical protein MRERC_4c013 [Mycoplasmataceae bacterium RC_NB112A]